MTPDHDLLIEVKTIIKGVGEKVDDMRVEFKKLVDSHRALVERVTRLEAVDSHKSNRPSAWTILAAVATALMAAATLIVMVKP